MTITIMDISSIVPPSEWSFSASRLFCATHSNINCSPSMIFFGAIRPVMLGPAEIGGVGRRDGGRGG